MTTINTIFIKINIIITDNSSNESSGVDNNHELDNSKGALLAEDSLMTTFTFWYYITIFECTYIYTHIFIYIHNYTLMFVCIWKHECTYIYAANICIIICTINIYICIHTYSYTKIESGVEYYNNETLHSDSHQVDTDEVVFEGVGWIINDDIDECMVCAKPFGNFQWRHHCRYINIHAYIHT